MVLKLLCYLVNCTRIIDTYILNQKSKFIGVHFGVLYQSQNTGNWINQNTVTNW